MNETPRPTDDEPFEKPRISMTVWGIVLVCGVIGALLWFGTPKLSAVPSLFATSTPTTTITSTPTSTPTATQTATPTRTLRPTQTATSVPIWVSEFAEPILAAIANNPPHFEDDFSRVSDGWRVDKRDDRCKVKIKDGVFTMSVEEGRDTAWCHHPEMQFTNFVLRVDADLRELGSDDLADIHWLGKDYSNGFALSILKDGDWSIYVCGKSSCTNLDAGWHSISPNQKLTVTIISKDREYIIYMDETPVSHINYSGQYPGIAIKLGLSVSSKSPSPMVIYDNLKIWNLDYIPNMP